VDKASSRPEFVQSLQRGLAVIRCFSREHPALTLSEVSRIAGLTRAAARRFLLTLEALGYVRMDGRDFSLTPRVIELGYAYLSSINLSDIAPYMETLSEQAHESCAASVLDGGEIVYLARVPIPAQRVLAVSPAMGTRLPAHATSMGRVLLAGLSPTELEDYLRTVPLRKLTPRTVTEPARLRQIVDSVRAQGWAFVDQELEDGVRAVAVPLRSRKGKVVAALNVAAQVGRASVERMTREILPLLLSTAETISRGLARR
jgi:IclR family pca regulon transcriptional regulator